MATVQHRSSLLQTAFWLLRISLGLYLLGSLLPAGQRAPIGPPQTVNTLHPHVCAHTSLIDEVDEWKIQRTLQLVREMGAPHIVEFFPWAYIEHQRGRYDWNQADRIVRHARNQGIHIIARLGLVPAWARPDDTTLNTIPEDSLPYFADYVSAFATRYAGTIDHLIIWNEPNLAFEWGYESFDPARYVAMLRAVYAGAHRANPNVTILAGALAATLEPPGSAHGLDDLLYLRALYDAGASAYFDALAVHTYGFTAADDARPAPDQLNFRRVELLRQIMLDHNDANTPVYITESGWNDDARWVNAVLPSQRIAYTIGALRWAENQTDWLRTVCLWNLRYPRSTRRYPDAFTLITPEFQLKPIYYAVQAYTQGSTTGTSLWLPPPTE